VIDESIEMESSNVIRVPPEPTRKIRKTRKIRNGETKRDRADQCACLPVYYTHQNN